MSLMLLCWLFAGCFGLAAGAYGYTWTVDRFAAKSRSAINDVLTNRLANMQRDFYDYKVMVAERFATTLYLKDVETRTAQRLDRIDEKLDRLVEKMLED